MVLDALPVIPWGFGKWLGNRGRVLNKMLSETRQRPFLLGDNQQRPSLFKKPSQFHLALKSGCRILPGSDPFPFRREQHKAGGFGFFSNAPFSAACAADDLLSIAQNRNVQIRPYGHRQDFVSFLIMQTAMWIRKMTQRGRLVAI